MTIRRSILSTVSLVVLASACTRAPAPAPDATPPSPQVQAVAASPSSAAPDAPQARAQAAAKAFSGALRKQLQGKMADGGPLAAVEFCKVEAPNIAEAMQAEHGVRLGRVPVAGRGRNPANAPGDWQAAVLADFEGRAKAGEPADALALMQSDNLPEGVALRMARGIKVEPGCLACHGKTVASPVKAAIARHYPDDAATGFDVDDLRGLLWVEVPSAPAP